MDIKTKKISNTEVEVTGEISSEEFEKYREAAISKLGKNVEIKGFRKGKVPADILEKQIGEMTILEEMAQNAIAAAYPKIIADNKIEAVDRPNISITKIAKGSPLGFKISQTVMPEFKLPNYKKIAGKVMKEKEDSTEVTDKELDEVLDKVRNSRKKDPSDEKEEAPALDDEMAKSLGDFKTVDELKKKLRENMESEKKMKAKDKRRLKIMEEILKDTKLDLPEVFIERESTKILEDVKADIAQTGMKFEDYLNHIKKTEEELVKGFWPTAEKRAQTGIVLDAIAKEEKIEADTKTLEAEIKKIKEHYPGADEHAAKHYVEGYLKNEQVFKLLEEQK